jgi:hypothetical protein
VSAHTGVHAATLIAETCRQLEAIADADGAGPIDAFDMAISAYEIITGDKVEGETLRLALTLAAARTGGAS